jgi:hypothetical protein
MKLFLPSNMFTSILSDTLKNDSGFEIIKKESALLCKQLESDTSAIALIPTLELINHRTLFVSGKCALSFDGMLSNSYLSFHEQQKNISKLKLRGDISINEIILAKILFSERYSSEIEFALDTSKDKSENENFLITGDENYNSGVYKTAISFSDQIAELLDLPYVNYVFASQDKESIEKLNLLADNIDSQIEDKLSTTLSKFNFDDELKNFVHENINSVYFEMTQNEIDAANELIKLVYYHGIIDDMFDVKFI